MDRYSITLGKPPPPTPPPKPKSLEEKASEFRSLPENEQIGVMQTLFGYDRETEALLENTFNRPRPQGHERPAARDAAVQGGVQEMPPGAMRALAAMHGITTQSTSEGIQLPEEFPSSLPTSLSPPLLRRSRGETIVEGEAESRQEERAAPEVAPEGAIQPDPELSPEDILNIIDNGELPIPEVERPRMPVYREGLVQVSPNENSAFQQLRQMINERLNLYISAENTTETRDRIIEIIQRIMHEEGGEAVVAQVLGNHLRQYFSSPPTITEPNPNILRASPALRGLVHPRVVPGEHTLPVNAEIQQEVLENIEGRVIRSQMEDRVSLTEGQPHELTPLHVRSVRKQTVVLPPESPTEEEQNTKLAHAAYLCVSPLASQLRGRTQDLAMLDDANYERDSTTEASVPLESKDVDDVAQDLNLKDVLDRLI